MCLLVCYKFWTKKKYLKIGTDRNPFSLSHQLCFANIFANTQMLYCHVNMVTGYPAQYHLNIKLWMCK